MKSTKKQKQKQTSFSSSLRCYWSPCDRAISELWSKVILRSPKSKTKFSLVQSKLATLRRPPIHINDEELVIGS